MTLRFASLDAGGNLDHEALLDERVCDCCGVDAVRDERGDVMVVYRDRSEGEVRDVSWVRWNGRAWSPPRPVFNDGWKIDGCPVNGPAVDSRGDRTAVTWFTLGRDDTPQVKLAFTRPGGRSFEAPIRVDAGNPEGRVDVIVRESGDAWVLWLEADPGTGAETEESPPEDYRRHHPRAKRTPAADRLPDPSQRQGSRRIRE